MGGVIRPDSSPNANAQELSIAKKGIGFKVPTIQIKNVSANGEDSWWNMLFFGGVSEDYIAIPYHDYEIDGDSISGHLYGGETGIAGRPFRYHLVEVVYGARGAIKSDGDNYQFRSLDGQPLSVKKGVVMIQVIGLIGEKTFWLGTDKFGRDMLSRLMAGTIVSLSVGFISVLISLLLGISLGATAGYFGGRTDDLITWIINVVWSIPTLLLVIAITFALGKGFVQVFIAVGLTMWVEVARVVRGQVMVVKNLEYVAAAKVLGYSKPRIIFRHIVPNVMGPVIVISAANFASAILLEAGLSFLGIGAQIPMASWGRMIKDHYPYITTDLAYLAILPGLCIVLLVLAFTLVGNGLRQSFDKRAA